jgi:hypothetical protein
MKQIVDKLTNTGSVDFNPFQTELTRPRYLIGVSLLTEDLIDSYTPEEYIKELIEQADVTYEESFSELNKENIFYDVGVSDSMYITTVDWASDDLKEAIATALQNEVYEIFDSQFSDYIYIDEEGNIVEIEDEE